ncbi:uncharacterized protein [Epargyreus clarus]|uniref:uncharacterized protein n=1 Tax=Epargyreus clarus TaxID=520877 RepID=UPI003C2BEB79
MNAAPSFKLLQGNLNHCSRAQDLLLQCLTECSVSLAVVAEPYRVPDHPRWFGDNAHLVAVYWAGGETDPPCSRRHTGQGIVAVDWGPLAVIGCYISPNCSLVAYEAFLGRVGDCIRGCLPRPVLVLGDFNAHSRTWGSKSDNARGNAGESIVDLSWTTASAERLVTGWRVAEEIVTLSDHRHITLDVTLQLPVRNGRQGESPARRWALKRLDRDMLVAAAHVVDWSGAAAEGATPDLEQRAARLRADMAAICDAAMPRVRSGRRGPAYWWSDHIAQLRAACLRFRRKFTRARRRRTASAVETEERYREYRNATVALQLAIAEGKSRSWSGLLDGLDRDPWGRP